MRKIFSKLKKMAKQYANAILEANAMCPSCMIPVNGHTYINNMNGYLCKDKQLKVA